MKMNTLIGMRRDFIASQGTTLRSATRPLDEYCGKEFIRPHRGYPLTGTINVCNYMRSVGDLYRCHLRSQIYTLQTVLKDVESDYDFNEEGATEDLKKVENMLRQLRKVTCEN